MTEELSTAIRSCVAPRGVKPRIVAIDGLGGAGKSTLADEVAREFGAAVVHTDDFATADCPLEWWPRLLEEALRPLAAGRPARFVATDFWAGELSERWVSVEPGEFVVIEGVSASRREFRPFLALSVWVQTPRDERLRRGLQRDGDDALAQWQEWMAAEDEYVQTQQPQEHVDLVVSGADATVSRAR